MIVCLILFISLFLLGVAGYSLTDTIDITYANVMNSFSDHVSDLLIGLVVLLLLIALSRSLIVSIKEGSFNKNRMILSIVGFFSVLSFFLGYSF